MNTRFLPVARHFLFLGLMLLAFTPAQAQYTLTSGGWFMRGTGTDFDAYSFVIPQDGEQGVTNAPSLATTYAHFAITNLYHLNATNTGSQSIMTNRIAISNAVAAFGSKYGGSPLYFNKTYRFGAFAGDYTSASSQGVVVTVVDRTSGAYVQAYSFALPVPANSSDWTTYMQGGATAPYSIPGLTTTFSGAGDVRWGVTNHGKMVLSFVADSTSSNYEYTVWVPGVFSTNWLVVTNASTPFFSPLFTMDFDPQPALMPAFVSQPQFQGKPLPPAYEGKSLTELLAVNAVVTNAVASAATNYTDLDNSPELRDHPILDQFVTDMGSNALALTSYVFNKIQLTDAVAYNGDTNHLSDTSVNLGGVSRSALGTYLEGQGSPVEQCALLVYLLRRAGVPAAYIYGPNDGVQMLDTRLSALLRMQIHGAVNQTNGQVYTTNTLISVNYPWVAAYVNGQWIHLFPWIKDTLVTEGLNLYDYMPANYNNGYKWVRQYLTGDTNIFSLSSETDVPSTLFPLFVQRSLLTNAPGVSMDDIGTTAVDRPVQFTTWSDFPTPFAVTNGAVNTVHDLTSITNIFPTWTNIFDTVSVRVYSSAATNKSLFTGDLRTADLNDRKFLIRHQTNGANFTLTLSLAPYRPALTNAMAFTNDTALLHQETMTMTLASTDDPLTVFFTRKRHQTVPITVTNNNYWASYLGLIENVRFTNSASIRLGDLAAICLSEGRVSKQMLLPWAQEYWTMQQEVKANPSLTNTLSPDITQGTLPYLMGMAYHERLTRFQDQLAQLHKVQVGTQVAQGLSVLAAQRTTNTGALITPINLYHPHVDMLYNIAALFGNASLRADSSADPFQSQNADAFNWLFTAEASAEEHKVIEDFYAQAGGISSVRLLLQAQQTNQPGMVELNIDNYASHSSLSNYDAAIWQQVVNAFTAPSNNYADIFITLQPVTNTAVGYKGMGAIGYFLTGEFALISGNGLPANGGWGAPLAFPYYNPPDYNFIDLSFNTSFDNSWAVTYSNPSVGLPAPFPDIFSTWNAPTIYNNFSSYNFGGADLFQQQAFDFASFDLGYSGAGAPAATYFDTVNNGGNYDPHIGDQYAQLASDVSDPVNAVTGEFYIDATDLSLPGPMPLFIRRNYSSQDVDMGDSTFGYGWRPAYTPYLRVVTNNVIFAAEMDGTVVAYRQPTTGTNFWVPTAADNPQLNNRSSVGMGSTANLFNNYITTNTAGGTTNYTLNGADGSVRTFLYTNYPIVGTNTFNRARPYLQTWTDANGNSYSFSYETDTNQAAYGQLKRVRSSNGNFLGFYYDTFGHITQAYTEDGRRLLYDYDANGDLLTVTFPDESQINYTYQHTNSVTNSVTNFFSTHLITQEQKPDGRVLANTYDSLRRVLTQAATVGNDLNLVTNATFTYSNNFTNFTNSIITGSTAIVDVFGHTNTYQYTSSQITGITDQLGQTISQTWYSNTNDTGYYPHSLKSMTDKRKLNTGYQYDTKGNLAQVVLTGNLTGTGVTNETATYSFAYTNRNLIASASNPSANQVAFSYADRSHPMLPTSVVKLASGTPVSTNLYFYTNVSQVVTNGAVVATNSSFGVVAEVIRGGFASNTFLYDGRGFMTQSTRYTGTADPAVTATLFYDDRGELKQRTDAAGRSLVFGYDGMGRPTTEEAFEAGATTPEGWNFLYYNENGDLVWTDGSRYNPEDYIWRDYDGAGRKITEMRWRSEAKPNGSGVQSPSAATNLYATTFYQYDKFNNLIKVTDPLGNYTTNQFDNIGQLTNSIAFSAAGVALATNSYAYEPGGKVKQAVNALGGVTAKSYTYAGKLNAQTNADSSTNGWTYYLDGRLHKEFLPNGNNWETIYDDAHLTVSRFFHNSGGILSTNIVAMDTRGNVITNIDPEGNISTNFFDGLDRIKAAAGPIIVIVTPNGNPPDGTYTTNFAQEITTYFYDSSGQTLTTSNALGETTVSTSDALGRPMQVAIYNAGSTNPVRVTSNSYSADHQSVTVTRGTGTTAIVSTTYTDNDGHPLLAVGSPASGVAEFNWWQYDLAGNRIAQQQCSSNAGTITVWATNGWTYDGLNRVQTETSKDGATTTYGLDALGDVTNRAMPGGLTWKATYLSDGRIASENETGGGLTARSMTYTYYSSGTSSAGRLLTVTDGRGTIRTNSYDDFMRLAAVNTGGSAAPVSSTSYGYNPSGDLLFVNQGFAGESTSTSVGRFYDAYHQVVEEVAATTIDDNGQGVFNVVYATWDEAGRRSSLSISGLGAFGFGYQADGQMTSANGATFGYSNNGLLTGRTNSNRSYAVNQRDGKGRLLQTTTAVAGFTVLGETLGWRNDGRLTNYVASRGDFTDTRKYGYSTLAQRLTQESFNVASSQPVTNNYTIDNGSTGGLGILTAQAQSGTISDTWSVPSSGGLDSLRRVAKSTDTIITRPAYGNAPGAATVWASLDGKPVSVQFDGSDSSDGTWRTSLKLFPGSHTLSVSAVDPSGQYSASTNSSFTANGGATDTITNVYDGNGNITQRIWVSSAGVTNRVQNLTYNAFDRLISVTDRDAVNSGLNWTARYDGLGRRFQTTSTVVVSNTPVTSPGDAVSTVLSWYDPQAEFLEVAAEVNDVFYFKTYGPDASGTYGALNGVGGLEAINTYGHTTTVGVVQDVFGNVLASISNSAVAWNPTRVSSYGPVPGYDSPALSLNVGLEQSLGWRGKRVDETGLIYLGARHYDPLAGHFTSADPIGHSGSMDLYSFAGGDPVNFFDPTGRFGKQLGDNSQYMPESLTQGNQSADNQMTYAAPGFQYADEAQANLAQWSALVDAIPVVGGLKMWAELNTGKDAFTGEWLDGNQYLQALGIVVNFAPVAIGPAALLEGGGETAFIGAGERGLMEVGGSEFAGTEGNIITVNFQQGEVAAEEATFNVADSQANGTYGGGASAGYTGQSTLEPTGGMNGQLTVVPSTGIQTQAAATQNALVPYEHWPTQPYEKGGFLGGYSQPVTAQPGQTLSRIGGFNGRYVSPPGTSIGERGLPSSYPNTTETLWEVVNPFEMEGGIATPWKDASGFGVQYKTEQSIQQLWDLGFIKPVPGQ